MPRQMRPVRDMMIKDGATANEIIKQMEEAGGFTAKKLAVGVDILERMMKDKTCIKFLSFPACIIATGTRGVIREMIRRKFFDLVITTCGTLDHDIARAYKKYYHGSFFMDDRELYRRGINRLGNVLVPNESYGMIIEKKMVEFLKSMYKTKKELATYELCWEIGKRMKNKKDSILYWVYKNKIPMIIPGITDGAVGYQIWQFSQDRDLKIDILKDEKLLSDLVWNAKRSGALVVGGGISKHHVIWWNQFKKGLDYVVYVTTAVEWDGSLSGARTREGVSWGKVKETAKRVTVEADATIVLPIILAALLERLKKS